LIVDASKSIDVAHLIEKKSENRQDVSSERATKLLKKFRDRKSELL